MKLSDIKPNPDNPRTATKEDIEKLKNSIEDLPKMMKARPIVIKDGVIVGGNQRYNALMALGKTEIPDEWVFDAKDWTEKEIERFIVQDNVSSGAWDWDVLANQYELEDLDAWGVELPEYLTEDSKEVEEDEVPEVSSEPPVSQLGVVYQLGRHRVMCGDSTDFGQVSDLIDGNTITGIYTDPPYGMNAVSKSGVLLKNYGSDIIGDDDNTAALHSFVLCKEMFNDSIQIWWGANYYSECLPSSECWIVWNKNNGGSDQTDCELAWSNARSVVRMYTQSSEKVNRVHPTQKPVDMAAWCFDKFKQGDNILDLFLGSGSTLIACEQTDRTCYGMELDPKYVDVIRKRYAKFISPDNQLPENWEELTPAISGGNQA